MSQSLFWQILRRCRLSLLQAVLRVVAASLPLFNGVNLATAVSRMGKMRASPDVLASASQHPALESLKAAVSAPHASPASVKPARHARKARRGCNLVLVLVVA